VPNGHGITRQTFVDADEKTRISMTFDLLKEIHENSCAQLIKCEERFKRLENRKWKDRGVASGSGTIGGAAISLLMRIFGG